VDSSIAVEKEAEAGTRWFDVCILEEEWRSLL
jgi:hypothetical protein